MLADLHSFIPSAPFPQFTNLLNLSLTHLSGHILSRTADMISNAVVAITKGEKFTPPLLAQAGIIPAAVAAAAGPSAAPSSSRPASAKLPSASPPADPSSKLSLQMQKDELVKAGYDKDYISRSDEAQIASLLEKEAAKEKEEAAKEKTAQEPPPAAPEYLIRSWTWSPRTKKYVIRAESATGMKHMSFDTVEDIAKICPLSFLRQLFLHRCINDENQEEILSAHSLLGKIMQDKVQQSRKKKKA